MEPSQVHQSSGDQNSKTTINYAKVTMQSLFPKKENAIIIDSANSAPIVEFIEKLSTKVNPSHIKFASKISNNRLCVYLSSKDIADDLVYHHKNIVVANQVFPIRPLISRNKRIILSNVCPSIPHQVIEEALLTFGVKTVVPLTFLRAGFNNPNLSHILSFRRQTFVSPDDEHKLPESFQVFMDNVPHWIYVTPDVPICFLCKNQGHIAKNCPNQCNSQLTNTLPLPTEVEITESNNESFDHSNNVSPNAFETTLPESELNESSSPNLGLDSFPPLLTSPPLEPTVRNLVASNENSMDVDLSCNTVRLKRPLSTVSSNTELISNQSDSEIDSNSETSDMDDKTVENKEKIKKQPSKNKKNIENIVTNSTLTDSVNNKLETEETLDHKKTNPKKKKKEDKEDPSTLEQTSTKSINELLVPAKDFIETNQDKFPLNFQQLTSFIENSYGARDPIIIAKDHTKDIVGLILMMKETYPYLTARSIKSRLTRITKKLKRATQQVENSETDTSMENSIIDTN